MIDSDVSSSRHTLAHTHTHMHKHTHARTHLHWLALLLLVCFSGGSLEAMMMPTIMITTVTMMTMTMTMMKMKMKGRRQAMMHRLTNMVWWPLLPPSLRLCSVSLSHSCCRCWLCCVLCACLGLQLHCCVVLFVSSFMCR